MFVKHMSHLQALLDSNLNLALCKHVVTISDFSLIRVLGSAIMMAAFSDKQRSHFRVLHMYGAALRWMLHFTEYSLLWSFSCQMCFASAVLLRAYISYKATDVELLY